MASRLSAGPVRVGKGKKGLALDLRISTEETGEKSSLAIKASLYNLRLGRQGV